MMGRESTPDTIQFIMPEPIALTGERHRRPYLEKKSQRRGMHIEDVDTNMDKPVELAELRPSARVSIIA
jgi:Amt family ammonium transporter